MAEPNLDSILSCFTNGRLHKLTAGAAARRGELSTEDYILADATNDVLEAAEEAGTIQSPEREHLLWWALHRPEDFEKWLAVRAAESASKPAPSVITAPNRTEVSHYGKGEKPTRSYLEVPKEVEEISIPDLRGYIEKNFPMTVDLDVSDDQGKTVHYELKRSMSTKAGFVGTTSDGVRGEQKGGVEVAYMVQTRPPQHVASQVLLCADGEPDVESVMNEMVELARSTIRGFSQQIRKVVQPRPKGAIRIDEFVGDREAVHSTPTAGLPAAAPGSQAFQPDGTLDKYFKSGGRMPV